MALSAQTYQGDGSNTDFVLDFTLGYISESHIHVYVDDEEVPQNTLQFILGGGSVRLPTAPSSGSEVLVRRIVPNDKLLHDYENGSLVIESNLDESNLQSIMLQHEAVDGFSTGIYGDINFFTEISDSPEDTAESPRGVEQITITGLASLAEEQRGEFETTFNAQFVYKRIGNLSDYVGMALTEEDKLNSYQYPDDSGNWYAPIQGQPFPYILPIDPTDNTSGMVLISTVGTYRGLWPDTDGSANKGDTYQTQVNGTGTGQYFTALQNTTVDPVGDDVNWREVISGSSIGSQVVTATGSSTPRRFDDRFSDIVNIKDYGVVADGVTNDQASLGSMLTSVTNHTTIDFNGAAIYLGGISSVDTTLFEITDITGLRFINAPTFLVDNDIPPSLGLGWSNIFKLDNCSDVDIEAHFESNVYDRALPKGICGISVTNTSADASNYKLNLSAKNMVSPFMTQNDNDSFKTSNIIANVNAENVTYGIRFVENGINCSGVINCKDHSRSYYSVRGNNHNFSINSKGNDRINDVLIKSYVGDAKNINIIINQTGSTSSEWPVLFEIQNDTAGAASISNCKVALNTDKLSTGLNTEFFRFQDKAGDDSIKDFAVNLFNNIEVSLNGDQSSSKFPKVSFGSRASSNYLGVVKINFQDDLEDTAGYTVIRGDKSMIMNRGPYSSFTDRILLTQTNRSLVQFKLTACGSDSPSPAAFAWYKEFIVIAQMTDVGGSIVFFDEVVTVGSSNAPTITPSFDNALQLTLATSNDASYQGVEADIAYKLEWTSEV